MIEHGPWRLGNNFNVNIPDAASYTAGPVGPQTYAVRIYAPGRNIYIDIQKNPVATGSAVALRLSDWPYYFLIRPGESVAVRGDPAFPFEVSVTELTK